MYIPELKLVRGLGKRGKNLNNMIKATNVGTRLDDAIKAAKGKALGILGEIQQYAYGTDAEGVDPNKRKLFDESSMTSQGVADVGFSTSSKNFGLNAGVGFNPDDLYGRVGGSFNKKGFNASAGFTQRPQKQH